jgi:hypothetical protein
MRTRVILLSSLGLNCALGLLLFQATREPQPVPHLPARLSRTNSPTNSVKTRVLVRQQYFTWGEIESPDYATYIANLRAIDCPDSTIRDIIVADVNQVFAQKRAKILDTSHQQWWRSVPDPDVLQSSLEKLSALETERRDLLADLLGPEWDASSQTNSVTPNVVDLSGPVLGDLQPEVKQAVQEISARAQQRQKDYLDQQRQAGQPVDPAELARLRQQTRDDLARVLNASQLEEYLLRYSDTATALRSDLTGFNATPDEFRQLFRIRDPYAQQIDLSYSGDDPASAKKRKELEQQEAAAIKQALGPDRYALYQLSQDPSFRQAQDAAQQSGAPADKVLPLFQVNQLSLAEQQRINNDPSLSQDEKEQALLAVRQAQQKSIRQILGAAVNSTPAPPNPLPPLPEQYPRP